MTPAGTIWPQLCTSVQAGTQHRCDPQPTRATPSMWCNTRRHGGRHAARPRTSCRRATRCETRQTDACIATASSAERSRSWYPSPTSVRSSSSFACAWVLLHTSHATPHTVRHAHQRRPRWTCGHRVSHVAAAEGHARLRTAPLPAQVAHNANNSHSHHAPPPLPPHSGAHVPSFLEQRPHLTNTKPAEQLGRSSHHTRVHVIIGCQRRPRRLASVPPSRRRHSGRPDPSARCGARRTVARAPGDSAELICQDRQINSRPRRLPPNLGHFPPPVPPRFSLGAHCTSEVCVCVGSAGVITACQWRGRHSRCDTAV